MMPLLFLNYTTHTIARHNKCSYLSNYLFIFIRGGMNWHLHVKWQGKKYLWPLGLWLRIIYQAARKVSVNFFLNGQRWRISFLFYFERSKIYTFMLKKMCILFEEFHSRFRSAQKVVCLLCSWMKKMKQTFLLNFFSVTTHFKHTKHFPRKWMDKAVN